MKLHRSPSDPPADDNDVSQISYPTPFPNNLQRKLCKIILYKQRSKKKIISKKTITAPEQHFFLNKNR